MPIRKNDLNEYLFNKAHFLNSRKQKGKYLKFSHTLYDWRQFLLQESLARVKEEKFIAWLWTVCSCARAANSSSHSCRRTAQIAAFLFSMEAPRKGDIGGSHAGEGVLKYLEKKSAILSNGMSSLFFI